MLFKSLWCWLCRIKKTCLQYTVTRDYHRQGHQSDVMMSTMASQITDISIVYSTVCSGEDQRKHQRSASVAFVRVNSPHTGPITPKMFPFDDVIIFNTVTRDYHRQSDNTGSNTSVGCIHVIISTEWDEWLCHVPPRSCLTDDQSVLCGNCLI